MYIIIKWVSKLLVFVGASLLLMVWQAEKAPATAERNGILLALGIALILPYFFVRMYGEEYGQVKQQRAAWEQHKIRHGSTPAQPAIGRCPSCGAAAYSTPKICDSCWNPLRPEDFPGGRH